MSIKFKYLMLVIVFIAVGRVFAVDPEWVETKRWSGNGMRCSEKFLVNGDKWRVRYRPKGQGLFQVFAYDKNGKLIKLITNQGPSALNGIKTLHSKGICYIQVVAGEKVNWTIIIEQHLGKLELWQLKKMKEQVPKAELIGNWNGEKGERQFKFTIKKESWYLFFQNEGGQKLLIEVCDKNGKTILKTIENSPCQEICWIHKPGEYTMTVKADETNWKIIVGEKIKGTVIVKKGQEKVPVSKKEYIPK